MRTTITLSKDVAAAVAKLRRQRGLGVSEAVNELARAGLAAQRPAGKTHGAFRQRSLPLGIRIDVSNVAEALEQLDGPSAR
jgi:hypothetical protein